MYRLGRQIHKHRRGQRRLVGLLIVGIFIALVWWLMHLRIAPQQDIRNATPVSKGFKATEAAKVAVDKPLFKMELPAGWREVPTDKQSPTAPKFSFRSPSDQAQLLDIYIDNPPLNMAINRAIIVSAQGDGIAYDTVSENCATYTDIAAKNPQTGNAPARWQTVNFICDMGNFPRAVVGTVSTEGVNQVTVNGTAGGAHKLFIAYTDNSASPNYSTLYDILRSLHFK